MRGLPAEVVTYYVMALGLLMAVSTREVLRVLVEGLRRLQGNVSMKVASKAAISQARQRLGPEPLRRLWESTAQPMAEPESLGVFYRGQQRVALDGSTVECRISPPIGSISAIPGQVAAKRPLRNSAWLAWWRPVHMVSFGVQGPYARSENALATVIIPALRPGMLVG